MIFIRWLDKFFRLVLFQFQHVFHKVLFAVVVCSSGSSLINNSACKTFPFQAVTVWKESAVHSVELLALAPSPSSARPGRPPPIRGRVPELDLNLAPLKSTLQLSMMANLTSKSTAQHHVSRNLGFVILQDHVAMT